MATRIVSETRSVSEAIIYIKIYLIYIFVFFYIFSSTWGIPFKIFPLIKSIKKMLDSGINILSKVVLKNQLKLLYSY